MSGADSESFGFSALVCFVSEAAATDFLASSPSDSENESLSESEELELEPELEPEYES